MDKKPKTKKPPVKTPAALKIFELLNGRSQMWLVRQTGIKEPAIRNFMTGRGGIKPAALLKIARVLNFPIEALTDLLVVPMVATHEHAIVQGSGPGGSRSDRKSIDRSVDEMNAPQKRRRVR